MPSMLAVYGLGIFHLDPVMVPLTCRPCEGWDVKILYVVSAGCGLDEILPLLIYVAADITYIIFKHLLMEETAKFVMAINIITHNMSTGTEVAQLSHREGSGKRSPSADPFGPLRGCGGCSDGSGCAQPLAHCAIKSGQQIDLFSTG